MYVGYTDHRGVFHLLSIVHCYFANEVFSGAFSDLDIVLHPDHSISMTGRNARPDEMRTRPTTQTRSVQSLAQDLNLWPETKDYRLGDSTIGLSLVNSLSQWLTISVKRGKIEHSFRWERGTPVTQSSPFDLIDCDEITFHWMPDPEIFGASQISPDDVERFLATTGPLLREAAYHFHDQVRGKQPETYKHEHGVAHLVSYLNAPYTPEGKTIRGQSTQQDTNGDAIEIDFALQFHREPGVTIMSAANLNFTYGGGTHAIGFHQGFQEVMAEINDLNERRDRDLAGPGYTAAISVRIRCPQYFGPTRSELGNEGIQAQIASFVRKTITDHWESDERLKRTLEYT
ncbi:hypothetical protein [Capsulimonas corticalis]|nr:hypothetical protein [Capsulimonas corticalis]